MRVFVAVLVCLLVAFTAVPSSEASEAGGLRFSLTQSGLNKIRDLVLPFINYEFSHLVLPDIHLDEKIKPLPGHITVDLTNIHVSSFNIPSAELQLATPATLKAYLNNADMNLEMNFKWRRVHWPHTSDHGSVKIHPKTGSLGASIAFSVVNQRPHTKALAESADFDNFDIHFSGHWDSWLYNLIIKLFKGKIKDKLQDSISAALQKAIDVSLNNNFATMDILRTIGGGKSTSNVNYGFGDIAVLPYTNNGTKSLTLSFLDLMTISNNATGAKCPYSVPAIPAMPADVSGDMVQIMFADEVFNCLMYTAYANGAMTRLITQKDINPKVPIQLNTTAWKLIAPKLYTMFPNQAMTMFFNPSVAPKVASDPTNGAVAKGNFFLNTSVVNPDGSSVPVFTLDAAFTVGLDIDVHNNKAGNSSIYGKVTQLKIDVTVASSLVGTINTAPFTGILHALTPIVQGLLNTLLGLGMPLPFSQGFTLTNPIVSIEQGFIAIAANFAYIKSNVPVVATA